MRLPAALHLMAHAVRRLWTWSCRRRRPCKRRLGKPISARDRFALPNSDCPAFLSSVRSSRRAKTIGRIR